MSARSSKLPGRVALAPLRLLRRYFADRRGAVTPIMVLALVPLIGALGMGIEASNWWMTQRALQNAADTAAMSATWNGNGVLGAAGSYNSSSNTYDTTGCKTTPSAFDCEAVGAASQAGFVNGSNNITVYPQYLTSGCPGSLGTCYKVTITKQVPLHLLGLVFGGSKSSQLVQAVAFTGLEESPTSADCLFSPYGPAGSTVVSAKGTPNANLAGCDVQVNYGNVDCSGNGLGADAIFAGGSVTSNGHKCAGSIHQDDTSVVSDPYKSLDTNIPNDSCSKYGVTQIATSPTPYTYGTLTSCGNLQLIRGSGNTVTLNGNTVIYIYNGNLDLNGFNLVSGQDAGVTIIFTGSSTTAGHSIVNIGNNNSIDIAAPTSGTWSGIAVYQDPRTNPSDAGGTLDISLSGNPTLAFSGVVYQPYANDTFTGAVDKSTNGLSCFVWVFNTLTVKGTADIFQGTQSQCGQAGVTQIFSDTSAHMLVG